MRGFGLVVDLRPWPEPAGSVSVRALGQAFAGVRDARVWSLGARPDAAAPFPASDLVGVVLSGSSAMVDDAPAWAAHLAAALDDWLEAGVPVLATCFGHQFVAHHLGGRVGSFDESRIGLAPLHVLDHTDPLLRGVKANDSLYWSHRDHVTHLPPALVRIAGSDECPIEAYRHRDRPLWGVQAHPESSAALAAALVTAEPSEGAALATRPWHDYDTPAGARILANFGAVCRERASTST